MGYMQDHAIIVSGWNDQVTEVRDQIVKAATTISDRFGESFVRLVGEVIPGMINNHAAFLIAPDGSKAGWETSERGDQLRNYAKKILQDHGGVDWVEVLFADDEGQVAILAGKDVGA